MFQNLPNLNAIRVFEAAARLNSFKDAADELNVTPTAISHQIRSLEDKLQTRLFERKTRSVSLTNEGKLLASSANESLRSLLSTINQLTVTPNTLTISTTNSFAAMWLVPNLEGFQQQHPNIKILIRAEESLIDIEHDSRVDMVIRYGKPPTGNLGVIPLIEDKIGFFATPEYWKKHTKTPSGSVFFSTKWKNTNLPNLGIEGHLKNTINTQELPELRYFDDENQTVQATLSGQGIGILSKLSVGMPLDNAWLTQGSNEMSKVFSGLYYYLVIPTRQQANSTALLFKAWLCNTLPKDQL
ncbi:LysR family transcriptional regulator [Marinomonas sp. C2222]|uniref:LysR family transcriptional regulator n=1 Tax=Marinomonas sargassi TaxID=2984494 RepID=A0ABT2YUN6_9GAMM|nr:LysR family transcriptional regulator [Marinomonas sargassi]MCV2403606.1 LysR family transcriptional regulator [Marinomonas sargassi]